MYTNRRSILIRLFSLIMVVCFLIPCGARAADVDTIQPRASYYLDSYNAYVYAAGGGLIQVYFSVTGTDYMDELGVLSIQIYECDTNSSDIEDWDWKDTFNHYDTDGMLSYNDDYHSGHVNYYGAVAGKYYRAYVCVWGGENGSGDTRYFWTSGKLAS